MRIRKSGFCALVGVLSLGASTTALGQGNPPSTDRTQANFELAAKQAKTKTCAGEDGNYLDFNFVYEGSSQGDPRLSGEMTLKAHALVRTNPNPGPFLPDTGTAGQAEGTYHINSGNESRAQGRFYATIGGSNPADPIPNNLEIEGVAVGPVHGTNGQGGGELIGNFRAASNDPQGRNVEGTLGGTGVPPSGPGDPDSLESPAFIQSGNCPGPAGG